ncbi:MAG: GH39 family glycosyl hydrolase [Puniceicoccales bacterium]
MRQIKRFRACLVLSLFCGVACHAQEQHPANVHTVLEPETVNAEITRVLVDPGASHGQYRAAAADGVTLACVDVDGIEECEVWVRYRGLPLALKNAIGMELSHTEGNDSGDWRWESLGQYAIGESGKDLCVFSPFSDRGASESPSGLDVVVVAKPGIELETLEALVVQAESESLTVPDADVVLTSEDARPVLDAPAEVNIVIDWSQETGRVADKQYSINIFNGYDPNVVKNPEYVEGVAYLDAPLLRYHNMSGMLADPAKNRFGWIDPETRSWDAERISAALDPLEGLAEERLITIGRWPSWMDEDKDGMLDKGQYAAFARLCAELVSLLNKEQGRGIQYFEISNERDMVYWLRQMKKGQPTQIDELAKIYNQCVKAMKAVDPTIKIGGPAACRGDLVQPLKQFTILTLEQLDFLSYHAYASGNAEETDVNIFNRADSLGKNLATIRTMLDDISPSRKIELHLNEYNICYTHRVRDKRMANHKGGIFDALVFVQLVENGADVGNAWNECDQVYGKMGRDYTLRPPAHIFHYFNQLMRGDAVQVTSDHRDVIVPFAVKHGNEHNWVLINRSPFATTTLLDSKGSDVAMGDIRLIQLTEAGLEELTIQANALSSGLVLPPESVTFFSSPN